MKLGDRWLPLNALRAFEAAGRHCHMAHAAAELGVTHGAVSHHVRGLEDALGVALFERTGNRIRLTPEGRRLLDAAQEAFAGLNRAAATLDRRAPSGRLGVECPPVFAARWLAPRLGRFMARHPQIEVHLATSLADEPALDAGIDVAVRYGDPARAGAHAVALAPTDYFPVASPALTGERAFPEDAGAWTLIHHGDGAEWRAWFTAAGVPYPEDAPALHIEDGNVMVDAVVAGVGVALASPIEAREHLRRGTLVRLAETAIAGERRYYVVGGQGEARPPGARAFADWLLEELAAEAP